MRSDKRGVAGGRGLLPGSIEHLSRAVEIALRQEHGKCLGAAQTGLGIDLANDLVQPGTRIGIAKHPLPVVEVFGHRGRGRTEGLVKLRKHAVSPGLRIPMQSRGGVVGRAGGRPVAVETVEIRGHDSPRRKKLQVAAHLPCRAPGDSVGGRVVERIRPEEKLPHAGLLPGEEILALDAVLPVGHRIEIEPDEADQQIRLELQLEGGETVAVVGVDHDRRAGASWAMRRARRL